MSPAKASSKPAPKELTLEFSGICTLVRNRKAGTADVHLVDLSSAGFQRHYPALGIAITESTPRSIKGPDADAAVSLPGEDKEMGLWNLMGANVEIVGASGKLTVDDSKIDATKKPPKTAASVKWLANIGELCDAERLAPACPTAAVIRLPAGHITATGVPDARRVEFRDNGRPVGSTRYFMPRFKAVIPFDDELAIRLSRERVLRFGDSMTVVVSNTCVCGLGVSEKPNHFYGHYEVVSAKRRPRAERAGPKPMFPWYPEICFGGYVEV